MSLYVCICVDCMCVCMYKIDRPDEERYVNHLHMHMMMKIAIE